MGKGGKGGQAIATDGHMLVTGGPGSGKTTVSIIKAARFAEHNLRPGQLVLFLGFARATVSRVIEAIEYERKIPPEQKKRILAETYHAFFWRVLKAHGYLIGLPRKLSILLPQNEAIALSAIRTNFKTESKLSETDKAEKKKREDKERLRLAYEDGRVCFDLFAHLAGEILHGSDRLRNLLFTMFPFVILDEFQDTNADQWNVVKAIGKNSTVLALADQEQRIYDWIGADPKRLGHFREEFNPSEHDLGTDNHRSGGTDILLFGNHILKGHFPNNSYNGIECVIYEANPNQAFSKLITQTLQARKRLIDSGRSNWCLAVLVSTRRMTRIVSDAFQSPPGNLPEIQHSAIIDMEAAILGAEIIALLMQPDRDGNHFFRFIDLLCNFFRGKGGDKPSKTDLGEAERIRKAYKEYVVRSSTGQAIRRNSIFVTILEVYDLLKPTGFSGDPVSDWLSVRHILEEGACSRLKNVANEVRNVRLLARGSQLRQALAQDWRDNGAYNGALEIVRQIFEQEYFLMAHRPEKGVVVMNMHKAKGKQFDEVIIFDGWPRISRNKIVANPDRIVWSNLRQNDNGQARQNFRVSVTRGISRTTILTPRQDPCILLLAQEI